MKSMNILVLTTQRWPLEHPFMEEVLAKGLPGRGHRVDFLMQTDGPAREMTQHTWHAAQVWALPGRGRRTALARLGNVLAKPGQAGRAARGLPRPDILYIRNDFLLAFWAFGQRRRVGAPVVFQYSFPAATAQSAGFSSRLGAAVQFRLLRVVARRADHLLPISEWMKQDLAAKDLPAAKMTPFPLGVDASLDPERISGAAVRARLGLGDAPTAIYFGSMHPLRGLDFLLRAWAQVQAALPDARLLMVGGQPEEVEALKRQAAEMGLAQSVVFTGRVPRLDVPEYIAAAQVGVSPIPPIPVYLISSPTKLAETLGMARPAVANDIPEQRLLTEQSGGGLCVPYEEGAFATALLELLRDPERARRMGQAGYNTIRRERSYQAMTERLEALFERLVAERGHGGLRR
jgi:glycosyltransferase involved in cell wall biosynthesis